MEVCGEKGKGIVVAWGWVCGCVVERREKNVWLCGREFVDMEVWCKEGETFVLCSCRCTGVEVW